MYYTYFMFRMKVAGNSFCGISPDMIKRALIAIQNKERIPDPAVYELLRKTKVSGALLPHTPLRKTVLRQQIFSMIHHLGWPTFFITISPNDLKSPLVKFLRGMAIFLK